MSVASGGSQASRGICDVVNEVW
jgi:hypothetical protein